MMDLISLMPDNNVKRVVRYCLDEIGLSLDETERVLYDATQIIGAVHILTAGRAVSEPTPASLGESSECS